MRLQGCSWGGRRRYWDFILPKLKLCTNNLIVPQIKELQDALQGHKGAIFTKLWTILIIWNIATLGPTWEFQLCLNSCNLASWAPKWHDYATGTTHPPPGLVGNHSLMEPKNRAEKSAEAFREQKFVVVLFLNFLLLLSIFLSTAEQFHLSVFGVWGGAVQFFMFSIWIS